MAFSAGGADTDYMASENGTQERKCPKNRGVNAGKPEHNSDRKANIEKMFEIY